MKLNHGISLLTKRRHILSCVSQLIFHCINHALWDGCVLWVLCFGCSHFFFLFTLFSPYCLFFIFMFILSLLCVFLTLTNSFRNPNLNASCCGFLQKLSVCLLSQLGPASDSHLHGMHTHACTAHRAAFYVVTVKTLLVS